MDLHEALLGRRTVFKYTSEPVDDDVLQRALEAARWAPNHKLTEPWHFFVVGPETRTRFAPIAERLALAKAAKKGQEPTEELISRQVKKVTDLPALVVVTYQRSPDNDLQDQEDYAAAVCALHNLVLSLWGDGLGAQWSTGGITRDDETYEVLGIDASRQSIIGFVKIGHAEVVPKPRRRPLDEVLTRLA